MRRLLYILSLLLSITFSFAQTIIDQGVKDVFVTFPIGGITYSATPPPGKITITGSDGGGGTGSTVDYPGGKDYQFKDKAGNIWTVDENGTVTQNGKVAEGGASNSTNTDGVTGSGNNATVNQYTAKGIKIVWEENSSGKYAYDTQKKTNLPVDKYPSVKDADGSPVSVPYKATVNKQTELFDAKVSITDPALKDAKIEFKTLSIGKAIPAKELNKTDAERTYQLELVGAFDYAEEEVIAVLMPKDSKDKQQVISSFRLVHLSPKMVDVSLVPLDANSDKLIDESSKKAVAIYEKIGVGLNLAKEKMLDINGLGIGNTIESGDPKLMSTYGSDQIKINNLYKGTDKRYVLFVTEKQASTGMQGYFRLNGQFGYLFGTAQQKTEAHELGHGIFKLEHPFESIGTTRGSTNLLMDDSTGEELSHLDWKQINDPAFKLYAFQSQSSGEFSGIRLTPDWKPFKFEGSSTHGNSSTCVNNGGICKIVKDGNEYSYENGDYYYIDKNNQKTPLKITSEPSAQTVTVVDYSKGCGKLYEVNLKDLKAKFNANSSVDFSNSIFKYTGDIACSDDNAPLDENSLGKKFYDQQTTPSMPDAVKTEMMKVAKLVQKMGKDIYNSYVYLEDEEYNPYNYAFNFPIRYPKKIETVEEAQSLYNQLNQHYQNCLAIESRNFKSGDELVQFFDDSFCVGGMMMKATTVVPFLNLTAERRLQLLTLLANNGTMSGNWSIGNCPKHENVILYILKTTPNEQTKAVLDGLYNKKLLYYFVDGMDGGNFDQFITILTTWIFKDYKPDAQTVSSALAEKRFLLFNDSYFGRLNTEKMNADGGVHLIVKKWFDSSKEYEVNSTPYNYIYVKFQNDFDAGSTKFAKGQTYKLPAIYAYMLMAQDTRSKWKTSGKIVIDVGLCALGVGELKAAIQSGQWAAAVLAATDIGIGIGDIVVNTAFKNEIQQAYPNFYNNWQTISTVYGIARLSQIGLEAAIKRTNIDAIVMSVDSRLSSEARSTADKIRKQLQNPENFAEYADNLVDEYNRIINESKNLETAEWVSGRTTSGEATNHYLFRKSGGRVITPYKVGTEVKDVKVNVGDKLYCFEDLTASSPGNWMSDKSFNSLEEAREQLALLKKFKPDGKDYVIREYVVKKPFTTRKGVIGEQMEIDGGVEKIYNGGANQWEINSINNKPDLWKEYFDENTRKVIKYLK